MTLSARSRFGRASDTSIPPHFDRRMEPVVPGPRSHARHDVVIAVRVS